MNRFSALVFFLIGIISYAEAQISTNSPYSRFGLGELQQSFFSEFNAFGGASTALSNSKSVNPSNPATYTAYGPNSFLFSTGGWHQTTKMLNATAEQIANNNAFSHLVVGFPLGKKIGASFGMIPFSSTGYEIRKSITDINNPDYLGTANYSGDGGLSKIYFGGAYELSNVFSIGVNASYLFGRLNRRKMLDVHDESSLDARSNSSINLKGYYYEIGLLYKTVLNENDDFTFGLTANNNSSISAKKSEVIESFEFSGFFESPKDTFVNVTQRGNVILPKYTSVGISYNKDKKWLFVADYNTQDWEDYTIFDESDNLANSMRISGGMQYTPEYNAVTKYYKRINYRFGASYSNTPLQFDNIQLTEKSISFGFGIPVKKSRTKYDLSCTFGHRGTTSGNLIKEEFIRVGLRVSYDGIWFVKRKYD